MTRTLLMLLAVLLVYRSALAQTNEDPAQEASRDNRPASDTREEPLMIEFGGFTNFVNNNYGQWSGANVRVMYRGAKHFAPMLGVATQKRPEGSQATFGVDSYILVNRWFYALVGISGSPQGSAVLWPKRRYGATGMIGIPRVKGLVGTVGFGGIDGEQGAHGRTFSAGALYYRGRAIWSGHLSFNRNDPGSMPSKSVGMGVQYGAQKKYWVGAGVSGGQIAYQTISPSPMDVHFVSFGPSVFFSKWVTRNRGFTVKYDYQDQVNAYQRHGIAASIFIEVP
jgi:YaiO family outer membrane protein